MNLLLLRGLLQDPGSWEEFGARLRLHAPHLKPFHLDLPGIGTEYQRTSPDSVPALRIDLAKRFHERIAQGKLPAGPWALAGSGIGAMIALDWAAAEPKLFTRLMLMNPSSSDLSGAAERFLFASRSRILWSLLLGKPGREVRAILGAVSNRFHANDTKMRNLEAAFVKSRRERHPSRQTALRHFRSAARFELPALNGAAARTIVVTSQGDRLSRPECSARVADHLGARQISHPWGGHDLVIDDPEWLARELGEWTQESL